jgi:hypothetical protein
MKRKITDSAVADLKQGKIAGDCIYDTEIRGFRVRRLPSGTVSFGFHYTAAGGARPHISLGLLGAVNASSARKLAQKYAGEVAGRGDPAKEMRREAARSKNTVNHVLDRWLREHAYAKPIKPSPKAVERLFERFVRSGEAYELEVPALGKNGAL